jgi:hypothetical protein
MLYKYRMPSANAAGGRGKSKDHLARDSLRTSFSSGAKVALVLLYDPLSLPPALQLDVKAD